MRLFKHIAAKQLILFIVQTLILAVVVAVSIKLFAPQLTLSTEQLYKLICMCATVSIINPTLNYLLWQKQFKNLIKGIQTNLDIINPLKNQTANTDNKAFTAIFSTLDANLAALKTDLQKHFEQINNTAEKVKSDALIGDLTGLPNRNCFTDFFKLHLQDNNPNSPHINYGCLAVVRYSQLQEINQARNYQAGLF